MSPPETSTPPGAAATNPASAGTSDGSSAPQPATPPAKKGTAARAMAVAPLALAVLAQVGVIGHGGGGTEKTPPPTGFQAASCGKDITDYEACHDHYATGCSAAGKYDGYLNSLKNELIEPSIGPQHAYDVPALVTLETQLPADLAPANHEALKDAISALGEGEVSSLTGYLYYAKNGGSESSNCLLKGADNIDFHIGIGPDSGVANKAKSPGLSADDRRQAVIVEMTPHWRAEFEPGWTLAKVTQAVGHKVYLVGQLLADNEHHDAKDDCGFSAAPGGANCWRPTIWELHPVTRFLVCDDLPNCSDNGTGTGWKPLETFDPGKAGGAAAQPAPVAVAGPKAEPSPARTP